MILLIFAAGVTNKFGSGLSPSPLPFPRFIRSEIPKSPARTARDISFQFIEKHSAKVFIAAVVLKYFDCFFIKTPRHRP